MTIEREEPNGINVTPDKILEYLREVENIFNSMDRVKEIQEALENDEISPQDLHKVVSVPLTIISIVISNSAVYKNVNKDLAKEEKDRLKKVKGLIDKTFPALGDNNKVLAGFFQSNKEDPLKTEINRIIGVTYSTQYVGQPPKLYPEILLGLVGRKDKLLLDAVLDWDDLARLSESLTKILLREMNNSKPLVEVNQIEVKFKKNIKENIEKLENNVMQIKELFSFYNIDDIAD